MRNERRTNPRDDFNEGREPQWLHGHHHGQNSDRGNYTIDTHFNRGYGDIDNSNTYPDRSEVSRSERLRPGGAYYDGDNYMKGSRESENPYGMSYLRDDDFNSGRHYDSRADYSNRDYDNFRRHGEPNQNHRNTDERFGHDVRSDRDTRNWARGSRGDYESYRRNEHRNPNYDNDYTTGFAGRNYARGYDHYGEGQTNSNLDRWEGRGDEQYEQYMRNRDR
jgi:hypothetical protein